MRKFITLLLVLAVALIAVPAFAGQKGAAAKAYEKAGDEAVFHRIGDWFATRGKSPEEAKAIKAERRAERAARRAQKEAMRAKKRAERQARKAKREMKKQQRKMKSKWGK